MLGSRRLAAVRASCWKRWVKDGSVIPNALRCAQYLLACPDGRSRRDATQMALAGGHRRAGQCALKPAGGLDSAQGLDGADEGAALGYDAVG